MYSIKEVKKKGLSIFKENKWTLIILAIIMTIVIGEYNISHDSQQTANVGVTFIKDEKSQSDLTNEPIDLKSQEAKEKLLNFGYRLIAQTVSGQTESITGAIKFFNEQRHVNAGMIFSIANMFIKGQEQIQDIINSSINMGISGGTKALLIVTFSIGLLIKIFFTDIIIIGEKRIYLESINYKKTKLNRIVFLFRRKKIKRYFNAVLGMLLFRIYTYLWNLTIIGGIIKHYSYLMVDYILAENPDIKPNEAIKISRNMMNGNKWKTFLFDISFTGWFILEYITLGLAGIFVTPYYISSRTALYEELRKKYIEDREYNYELLNDEKLFEVNDRAVYPISSKANKEFTAINYDFPTLVLFFFIFAMIGWIWECTLMLFQFGKLVNRGALYGPWLPIYGFGCSIILLMFSKIKLLRKISRNPFATFIACLLICSALEYFGSWIVEKVFNLKYWDYTGYFMNINGRVCLENAIFFGIGGTACLYIAAPFFARILNRLTSYNKIIAGIVLICVILVDWGYSIRHPHTGDLITSDPQTGSYMEERKNN